MSELVYVVYNSYQPRGAVLAASGDHGKASLGQLDTFNDVIVNSALSHQNPTLTRVGDVQNIFVNPSFVDLVIGYANTPHVDHT